jgi:uncharacterized repeat protein (TIGR03803 family)
MRPVLALRVCWPDYANDPLPAGAPVVTRCKIPYHQKRQPSTVALVKETIMTTQDSSIRSCVLRRAALPVLLGCIFAAMASMSYAQTYTILYNFTGGLDGNSPLATLTLDPNGILYGTAFAGGQFNNGTVFRGAHQGSDWVFTTLWLFPGVYYGSGPDAPLVFGPGGALYGSTVNGGNVGEDCYGQGCGAVFKFQPTPSICRGNNCWETLLGFFETDLGVTNPSGPLVFDSSGTIYGTTRGDDNVPGTVYELATSDYYIPSILYSFPGRNGQGSPQSGVIFDSSGNLYGTQGCGGGTIFKLTPHGSSWSYSTLFDFTGARSGCPVAGLLMTPNGNLYATNSSGGGAAFRGTLSGGSYTFSLMTTLGPDNGQACGPQSSLIMDSAGNFYGTTYCDGAYGRGSVFKISPAGSGWTVTNLHDFAGRDDGQYPVGGVVMDSSGHLYGTTSEGGAHGVGTVWEITP